jgi:hypothetical protein
VSVRRAAAAHFGEAIAREIEARRNGPRAEQVFEGTLSFAFAGVPRKADARTQRPDKWVATHPFGKSGWPLWTH